MPPDQLLRPQCTDVFVHLLALFLGPVRLLNQPRQRDGFGMQLFTAVSIFDRHLLLIRLKE